MRLRRSGTMQRAPGEPIRVVRVISRLNVGGPAIQVIMLANRLRGRGYETTVVHGTEGPDEGNMHHLAVEHSVHPEYVPSLQREIGLHDLRALFALVRIIRRDRPHLLHTHAAKAGLVGRVASMLSGKARPAVRVHTFHGHVFDGVFTSSWKPRLAVLIERRLAQLTTRFVAVSEEIRDDLVRYRVAPREKVEVVHLGFDLSQFVLDAGQAAESRERLRDELQIGSDAIVVTLIARVVQMKRVDRFLRVAKRLMSDDRLHFLIVGDGEQQKRLEQSAEAEDLAGRLTWAGIRHDIGVVCAASDVIVLTSDNEGTPVALIEAQASGTPVVATNVGGVKTVVRDGETGLVFEKEDEAGLVGGVRRLIGDPELRARMGAAGRDHVLGTFTLDRLVDDIDSLYRRLLLSGNGQRRTGEDATPALARHRAG